MPNVIKGVQDAGRIFFYLADQGDAGVREISRELDIGAGTVFRILASLETNDLVESDSATERYRLGPAFTFLSAGYERHNPFLVRVKRQMRQIVAETGRSIELITIRDNRRAVIFTEEPPSGTRFSWGVGSRNPLYIGASGKALLAQLGDDEIEAYLSQEDLVKVTEATVTDPNHIRVQVQQVRSQGYIVTESEGVPGVIGCMVPVWGSPLGPLVLGGYGTTADMTQSDIEEFVGVLTGVAQRVSASGWSVDPEQL